MMRPSIGRELASARIEQLRADAGSGAPRGGRTSGRPRSRRRWRLALGRRLLEVGLRLIGTAGEEVV